MLSLREFLTRSGIRQSEFARRLAVRLGKRVRPQNVHRWTREKGDPVYVVPEPAMVEAIFAETEGLVTPASWYTLPAAGCAVGLEAERRAVRRRGAA